MLTYTPIVIPGVWRLGHALAIHSIRSFPTGPNQSGHMQFDTLYTPLGDHLYRLKYKADVSAIAPIAECAVDFLTLQNLKYDVLIPVLPSSARAVQPVILLATKIAADYGIPLGGGLIQHSRPATSLKNVASAARPALISGLYTVPNPAAIRGANILLFDDLYQSGATMNAITQVLLAAGARMVDALTITKTK